MAADPYGYNDTDTVNESRRKAQMDALNDAQAPASSPVQAMEQIPNGTVSSPTANATAPTGGGGGGGGAMAQATAQPAFQAPQRAPMVGIANATPATAPPITDEVTALLRARLQSLSNPMDLTNDPIYQNQLKAYDVGAERNKDRERAALAQRMYARGTSTGGGLDTGIRGLEEQQSERSQAYGANLAAQRFADREDQLNKAISYARAVGQDDVALQLENEKMKLAAEALQLQQSLGQQDIDLRTMLGSGQLDLGYGNLGLGYANLITNANANAANSVR